MNLDVVELARELIRTPSPNPGGDECAVAGVVEDALETLGLPRAQVIAKSPERPNLLSRLDFGPGGRHLVLSGHLDTKPVGDAVWTADPWAADIDGDRLYGLGSADMKAAVAAMLLAAARVAPTTTAGSLTLLFTADEEDGAAFGSHHVCAAQALNADAVVIGEPGGLEADWDHMHLVSRGILRLRVVARARQGHSSLSGRPGTRNAGVDVARAVVELTGAAVPFSTDSDGLHGWQPTVNTGLRYDGGVGFGVLPGAVAVRTEVRLLPGMEQSAVLAALDAALDGLRAEGADLTLEPDAPPGDWLPATAVPAASGIAQAARAASARVLGRTPPFSVFPGTTDATWFDRLQGVPTLPALGPGLLGVCHAADEWVSVQAVRQAVDVYADLADTFCAATAAQTAEEDRR